MQKSKKEQAAEALGKFSRNLLKTAHAMSLCNEKQLKKAKKCGCFHCGKIFSPKEIENYAIDPLGKTAVCPHCGVDSVLADGPVPVTETLLADMRKHWFSSETRKAMRQKTVEALTLEMAAEKAEAYIHHRKPVGFVDNFAMLPLQVIKPEPPRPQ